jgi:hypothetical protein
MLTSLFPALMQSCSNMSERPLWRLLVIGCVLLSRSVCALEWQAGTTGRSAALPVPSSGNIGFTQLLPALTGISFTNLLSVGRYTTNQIYLNGSGVAAGDVDGDGWVDLYFCGLDNANVLYRNLGNWKFQDITQEAGVACAHLDATGAALADLDGDGDLDLLVNSIGGGTEIFFNDGKGHFAKSDVLNRGKGAMSLALADIDGDGDLDLYIANYRTATIRDEPNTRLQGETSNGKMVVQKVNGRPVTAPDLIGRFSLEPNGKIIEHGEVDVLYRNDGVGKFTPLSFTDGTFLDEDGKPLKEPPYDWGLSVMFRDLNGDGAPDIYVCNDFGAADRIWINDGQGRFRALPRLSLRHTSMFSMGIDFADVNRDGFDDFFVADMLSRDHRRRHTQAGNVNPLFLPIGQIDDRPQYSFNTLQLNRGDGTYADISQFSGVDASEWSWTPVFLDVDLDGYEDLLITTGHERDSLHLDFINRIEAKKSREKLSARELLNLQKIFPRLDTANVAFRNRGDLTFEEVSAAWGFDARGVSHGLALADLDNDGDLDVVINNLNGLAGVYRNEGNAPRLAVRLKGSAPNTRGIGAKIKVPGGPVAQTQEMICGGRYLSSDDAMRVFAAGNATNELTIEVTWRGGKRSSVGNVVLNRIYEVDESAVGASERGSVRASERGSVGAWERGTVRAEKQEAHAPRSTLDALRSDALTLHAPPLFEDASDLIKHTHHEETFDDFARQPLLPNRLSQLGPGVSWHDVDGDGWEDLSIGSGRGGELAVFRNNGRGGFAAMNDDPVTRPVTRDQTTILGLESILLAGSANYEDGLTNGGSLRVYDLKRKATGESILGQLSSRGPLAMADIDGDGDLDLFVGGRVVPGRYPEPATSLLLRNEGGRFVPVQRFEKLGLVSGAVFSDLDGDGKPELILACEWGPVRVFRNEGVSYKEATEQMGLAEFKGWWNGVTTGDLDGDGRLDIIASNWGLNSKYRTGRAHPRRLYYGDLNGAGGLDLVEAYYDEALGKEVPERVFKSAAAALPFLRTAIPSYEAYSCASVVELYGDKLRACSVVEANTLASMAFFNRGNRFEGAMLPKEAQFAPAFGVSVGDIDGDGIEDVFLSQNFFATSPESSRCDAGRGLWLRGDGTGGLQAVSGQESGVKAYGEQRGCAVADYDGDGRVDLVVTQNGAATKLYHNVGAKPGLRVRLRGGTGNPTAVGAAMRLIFGPRRGPVREIHAGSGYWSQDGAVQVLSTPEPPTQLWVRWPGGNTTTNNVPSAAREVEVNLEGNVKLLR